MIVLVKLLSVFFKKMRECTEQVRAEHQKSATIREKQSLFSGTSIKYRSKEIIHVDLAPPKAKPLPLIHHPVRNLTHEPGKKGQISAPGEIIGLALPGAFSYAGVPSAVAVAALRLRRAPASETKKKGTARGNAAGSDEQNSLRSQPGILYCGAAFLRQKNYVPASVAANFLPSSKHCRSSFSSGTK